MAKLGMKGPFEFTSQKVNEMIENNRIGNYALGYITKDSNGEHVFCVKYVGRSDNDLNDRIKDHLGESKEYTHFKFSYETCSRNAFLKECRNWHDFGGEDILDNHYHPDKPNGTNWKCPVCEA